MVDRMARLIKDTIPASFIDMVSAYNEPVLGDGYCGKYILSYLSFGFLGDTNWNLDEITHRAKKSSIIIYIKHVFNFETWYLSNRGLSLTYCIYDTDNTLINREYVCEYNVYDAVEYIDRINNNYASRPPILLGKDDLDKLIDSIKVESRLLSVDRDSLLGDIRKRIKYNKDHNTSNLIDWDLFK